MLKIAAVSVLLQRHRDGVFIDYFVFALMAALIVARFLWGEVIFYDDGYYVHKLHVLFDAVSSGAWYNALDMIRMGHFEPVLLILSPLGGLPSYATAAALVVLRLLAFALTIWRFDALIRVLKPAASPALLKLWFYALPSVWMIWLFDFHPEIFVLPLVFQFVIDTRESRPYRALFWLACLCFLKEAGIVFAAAAAVAAAMMPVSSSTHEKTRERVLYLTAAIIFCTLFVFVMQYGIVQVEDQTLPNARLKLHPDLTHWGTGIFDITGHIFRFDAVAYLVTPERLLFLVKVFLPLLAVAAGVSWWLLPVMLAVSVPLLSDNPNHFSNAYHYAAWTMPFIAVAALARWRPKMNPLWVMAVPLLFLWFSPAPWGRLFWGVPDGHYSYARYVTADIRKAEDKAATEALTNLGPNDCLLIQNNFSAPALWGNQQAVIWTGAPPDCQGQETLLLSTSRRAYLGYKQEPVMYAEARNNLAANNWHMRAFGEGVEIWQR